MTKENQNWLHDLFISEAKAAQNYHNRGGEEIPTQEKTLDITENGTVIVEPDEGHTMSKVTANVSVSREGVNEFQRYVELNGNSLAYAFYGFSGTSGLDEMLAGMDTSAITTTECMFGHSDNLESVPLFNTSAVTNMKHMFTSCDNLKTVPLYDTHNVTDMQYMFYECKKLETVPLFDTSNVINMERMFYSTEALVNVPLFDMSNVRSMRWMFCMSRGIKSIPPFNCSKVTDMQEAFSGCYALTDVGLIDTSSVNYMQSTFSSCYALQEVAQLNTSNVTNMNGTFCLCRTLKTIPLLDTRRVTVCSGLFQYSYAMEVIPALDMRSCTNFTSFVMGDSLLTECWIRNIKANVQVGSGTSYGHLLTLDSLLSLCKECRNTGSQKTLTVGSANLEKLATVYVKLIDITDEMRAEDDLIDEKSPFVQCESTDEGAMLIADYMTTKNWVLK